MVIRKKTKKGKDTKKLTKSVKNKDDNKIAGNYDLKNETKQLFWFFAIIIFVFAIFLIPYFWTESSKSFEYSGVSWMIEDYNDFRIYHGIFMALNGANLNYNIFLRDDPRNNNIITEGDFVDFKYGGIVSITPEVDKCRGELSRVMLDLGAFLKQGVGVGPLVSGSTDKIVANETNRQFAKCDIVSDRH